MLLNNNIEDIGTQQWQSYSKIYKWSDSDQEMISVAEIKTQGATDFEHIQANNVDYLVISNEGNIQSGLHQISQIFELGVVNEDRLEQIDS